MEIIYENKDKIPIVEQKVGQGFKFIQDGVQRIDMDAFDDKIFIGEPQKRQINLSTTVLQSVGFYDDDFKPYLFSGLLSDNFKSNTAIGQVIDHALYNNPLDRSYIPQAGFPRLENYMSGKFWGGQIEKYLHIRVNRPGGMMAVTKGLYDYAASGDSVVSSVLKTVQKGVDALQDEYNRLLSGVNQDQFYPVDNFPLLQYKMNSDDIPIPVYKSLFLRRVRNPLEQLSPIYFETYTQEDFENDYISHSIELTTKNDDIVKIRQDNIKLALQSIGFNQYYNQKDNPLKYMVQQSDNIGNTRSITLFENNVSSSVILDDVLSYQISSYKLPIKDSIQDTDYDIIKFHVKDVNNERYLITPAFLTGLKDSGLQGQWQQMVYAGGVYPQFKYKGTDKREINFTLQLGCFSKQFLPQYIEKLNFLRLVGTPTYSDVSFNNNTISLPKAPIYQLTLGDIVKDQYGYMITDFQWPDDLSTWNLSKKRTYKGLKGNEIIEKLDDKEIQIPIYTQISVTFVCMYGRGFSNTDNIYDIN